MVHIISELRNVELLVVERFVALGRATRLVPRNDEDGLVDFSATINASAVHVLTLW